MSDEVDEMSAASRGSGEPDTRGPAVIVTGSVIGGFTFIGPFPTIEHAAEWHSKRSMPGVLGLPADAIVLLESPDRRAVVKNDE
jgi:hypothetical protein